MLHIEPRYLIGNDFYKTDPNRTYRCIGYGQAPDNNANYVVGTHWDQASNRTTVETFLFKEITFVGKASQ